MIPPRVSASGRSLPSPEQGERSALAALLVAVLLAFAWVGRSVATIDGAIVVSDALGFLVYGRFESPPPQTGTRTLPSGDVQAPSVRSQFGLFPSALATAFLTPAWPLRRVVGARGLEAAASLLWASGAALSTVGFLALARALRPAVSSLWAPAFLAGTFLYPYAAESFFEPWAGGLLAFGAASVLTTGGSPLGRGAASGLLWGLAALLKPVLWVTGPVLVLAAALSEKAGKGERRGLAAGAVAGLGTTAVLLLLVNLVRTGSPFDVGYGVQAFLFGGDPLPGLVGLTVGAGRGLVWFAPVVVGSLVAARRLRGPEALLCLAAPAVLLLVVSRFLFWDGSTCWGPRLVLGVLPLLAAPAVLLPRLAAPLLALGAALNLPGVLVAPGAWISYAEGLTPRTGAAWPAHGSERVSTVPVLSPIYGHVWLLSQGDGRSRLPAPWLGAAASPGPPPRAAGFVSPAWLRAALGLAPVRPLLPRLLLRGAVGWAARGQLAEARLLAEEARRLAPDDAEARALASSLAAVPSPRKVRP